MNLTHEQYETVLDLVDQACVCTHTFEQAEDGAAREQKIHRKAVEKLTEIYTKASFLGVPDPTLMSVLSHNLPSRMSVSIEINHT